MATSKAYLEFVLGQLSELDGISTRAMMGEYVLYYQGKVVGGIYDDRLLLKPTKTALEIMRGSAFGVLLELPSEGAKEMLMPDVDDPALCCRVIRAIEQELPAPRKKR